MNPHRFVDMVLQYVDRHIAARDWARKIGDEDPRMGMFAEAKRHEEAAQFRVRLMALYGLFYMEAMTAGREALLEEQVEERTRRKRAGVKAKKKRAVSRARSASSK